LVAKCNKMVEPACDYGADIIMEYQHYLFTISTVHYGHYCIASSTIHHSSSD